MSEEEVKEEKKKGGKGLIIAIIGILVVLIAVVVFLVMILMKGDPAAEGETASQATKEAPAQTTKGVRSDYAKMGPTFSIPEPFVVNLMGNNGRRYLKASVALEMSSPELQKEVNTKLVLIKDRISQILSSKTYEEVSTPKGKEKLKEEILQDLNSFMVDGYFKSVFIPEFTIQ